MDTYGLVGWPLGHSFSRRYFTEKFEREGLDAEYLNFELENVSLLPEVLANATLRGFNVTIPYKQAVMAYLDRIDPVAREIGAVNVVKVESDGTLTGYNSDVYGFVESIRGMMDGKVDAQRAMVLGVGGASRAVVHGLRTLGLEVTQVSRREGAGDLTYDDLTADIVGAHGVVVNTTPLGMYPNVEGCPQIPYEGIGENHLCFDLVYNPLETEFMKRCAAKGAKVKNGLEMLHLQADRAWEIWLQQ